MPIGQNRLIVFSFFPLGGCPYTMVTVKTTTTWNGEETNWSVGSCENEYVFEDHKTVSQTCCLEKGINPIMCKANGLTGSLWINEDFETEGGHGWGGGYLEINGQKFCDRFLDGYSKEEYVNI